MVNTMSDNISGKSGEKKYLYSPQLNYSLLNFYSLK